MSETSESLETLSDILHEPLHNSILNSAEKATSPSRQIWDVIPTIENDTMDTGEPVAHQSLFVTPEPEASDNTYRLLSTPVPSSWSTDIKRASSVSPSHIHTVMEDREDVNMVKEEDCTPSARENLRSLPSFESDNDKMSIQKKLPKPRENTSLGISRTAEHNTTLLTQKALLQRRWAKNQNENSNVLNSASQTLIGGGPKKPVRPIKPVVLDEAAELAILMNRGSEENAWMVNDNENDEGQNELEILKARKREIKRRKMNGRPIENDDMQLLRVNELIATITRRQELANRRGSVSPNTINPELEECKKDYERDQSQRRELYNQMQEGTDFGQGCAPKKAQTGKEPQRRRGKVAKTAAEFTANEISKKREKEREKQRKKRDRQAMLSGKTASGRKARGSKIKEHGNGKQKKKPGPKKVAHPSRMKNGRGVDTDPVMQKLIERLVPNDAIADRVAREDFVAAPTIHESVKEKQLKALFSSVPDSYDSHRKMTDKRDIKRASGRFGFGNVKAVNGMWMLKGMRTPLYHHQLLAADFMVGRELATDKPHGGLLADAMGLGKTLETLATMVGNPPSPEDLKNKIRTTLIVMPSSAIRQWDDEIKKHVKDTVFNHVLHYKASKDLPMSILQTCDVIITSYAEVMASYPFPKGDDIKNLKGGLQEWLSAALDQVGDLHKMEFYRVVLDEAHAIKNFTSRTSLACINLNGRFRWALSGTPIQNRLQELYPYFKFLRADWAADFQEFQKLFCNPDADDASLRIRVILSICMIYILLTQRGRRTMQDQILGRPIVDLPKPHPETMHVELSRHERTIYRILEDRFRDVMNQHFKQGTAEKNYGMFLVQLLRLRQCVAHPFLLEQTIKEIFTAENLERLKADLRSCNRQDARPIYEQISLWTHEKEVQRAADMASSENPQESSFGRSEFGKHFRMETFLKSFDKNDIENIMERVVCRICCDLPRNAVVTECKHIFCRSCLDDYLHQQAAMIDDQDDEYTECPACKRAFSGYKKFDEVSLLDDDEQDSNESSSQKIGRQTNRRKGHKDGGPCIMNSKWLNMCIADKNLMPLPSAKTVALKAQILKWFADSPDDKILIFTQFRMMARIVGLIAEKEKWGHVYFTGDMNIDQRHDAVQKFHDDRNIRIMIAGLKCGGQALNLTCANRCISLDLWWNHSVEMQGFGRIFRIGQRKETYFTRIVVRDTVDTRMLQLQAEKIREIDLAMQDNGSVVDPLNMQDLASLFGHLVTDDDGKWRVERDYEVDDEPTYTPET